MSRRDPDAKPQFRVTHERVGRNGGGFAVEALAVGIEPRCPSCGRTFEDCRCTGVKRS